MSTYLSFGKAFSIDIDGALGHREALRGLQKALHRQMV